MLDSFVSRSKRGEANPVAPANLERLESFFEDNALMMRHFVMPSVVTERDREKAAKELFIKYGVFADPGTASAYAAACGDHDSDSAVVLVSQNHPSLSSDYCRHVTGEVPQIPEEVARCLKPVRLNRPVVTDAEALKTLIKGI